MAECGRGKGRLGTGHVVGTLTGLYFALVAAPVKPRSVVDTRTIPDIRPCTVLYWEISRVSNPL